MTSERPRPFDLLFGALAEERFPAIRAALGGATDINAFVLVAPALELLRELRPDEALDAGMDDFVALIHAAYRYWCDGRQTVTFDESTTRRMCRGDCGAGPIGGTTYVQIGQRLLWGQLDRDLPFEPLDGWFAHPVEGSMLRMVACFGVHAQRPGVSVVAVQGVHPGSPKRPDGTALFAPTMSGGDVAGLHAVTGPEELLLLGWRAFRVQGEGD